jgi:DNA polymerase III delta subunit
LQVLELARSNTEAQIGQSLRIHPFVISKLKTQATSFGQERLLDALTAAFEADWAIKTSTLTPLLAWELFVWRISRGQKRQPVRLADLEFPRVRE